MTRGGKALTVSGCVAAAACAQTQSVKVRAIADPAKKERVGGDLLADARAQLALGDVGIALETFRTLARQQPDNPDAYAGIAACYAAMGRFDIARQNYELALAFAPNDPALLLSLAGSLDQLGAKEQASQVRVEAARLRAPTIAPVIVTPPAVKQLSSVTVKLPRPSAASMAKTKSGALPSVATASPAGVEKTPASARGSRDIAPAAVILSSVPAARSKTDLAPTVEIHNSARAETPQGSLPPAREPALAAVMHLSTQYTPKTAGFVPVSRSSVPLPVDKLLTNSLDITQARTSAPAAKTVPLPAVPTVGIALRTPKETSSTPVSILPEPRSADRHSPSVPTAAQFDSRVESGPRLRRLSPSEVSLLTIQQPVRFAQLASSLAPPALPVPSNELAKDRPAGSAARVASAVRWIPLKYASAENIQLLNAARSQSLAAHVRMTLLHRGWRKIGIGDARLVRQHSLVLYSAARWRTARRLAAQFHCKAVQTRGINSVLVLLGRDAASARRATERA